MAVYSEPGIGTTFKVYLPTMEEPVAEPRRIHDENGGRGTETILIVEDDDRVRELAVFALQSRGYTVLAAGNGLEATRVLRLHPGTVQMLVTDVVMPGMGGPELAESLRLIFPEMKVVYSSGYTDHAVIRHGLLEDKVAFLQKPYTPQTLAGKVRQVLDSWP